MKSGISHCHLSITLKAPRHLTPMVTLALALTLYYCILIFTIKITHAMRTTIARIDHISSLLSPRHTHTSSPSLAGKPASTRPYAVLLASTRPQIRAPVRGHNAMLGLLGA